MAGDYGFYSHVYEMPFVQHLSLVVVSLNRQAKVREMAAAADPQEALLDLIRKRDKVEDKPQHPDFNDEDVVTLAYSLGRTIQSMATYGRSISSLLQDVRDNNNHDSLLKAVRMDRTVIGCPTAMKLQSPHQPSDNGCDRASGGICLRLFTRWRGESVDQFQDHSVRAIFHPSE